MLRRALFALCTLLLISQPLVAQSNNSEAIVAIAWHPSGTKYATGHRDGTVRIWDLEDSNEPILLLDHSAAVLSLIWNQDGNQLLSGSSDETVRVWQADGTLLATLSETAGPIETAVWNPDESQILAFGGATRERLSLRIWDSSTYELVDRKAGAVATDVKWNSDFSLLAMSDLGGGVQLLDTVTFNPITSFGNFDITSSIDGLYSLAWHPNSPWIATGSYDGWARIWNVATQQILFEEKGSDNPIIDWNTSSIRYVFFDPTGTYLTSISSDGKLRTWDITTAQLVKDEQLSDTPLYAVALSPDGTRLAYGGESGVLHFVALAG